MRIHAAVLEELRGPFSVEPLELEEPRDYEVLVRIVGTGICHSDIALVDGDLPGPTPIVLGHEGSGVVERTGRGVSRVVPGDHVVMTLSSCGDCRNCLQGHPRYCLRFGDLNLSGGRLDGSTAYSRPAGPVYGHWGGQSSFATHALVRERGIVKVPKDAPLELLGPLGCGVQTGAGTVLNVLRPPPGTSLAVVGTGTVGLSAVMGARVAGCTTIIAVDLNPDRLALATELGATHCVDSTQGRMAEDLMDITGGMGLDYCVDTTAVATVMQDAFGCLAVRGTLAVLGVPRPDVRIELDPLALVSGRTVTGANIGDTVPEVFIPYLLDLHSQGRFPFERLITSCGGLDAINDAVDAMGRGKVVKPVLSVG